MKCKKEYADPEKYKRYKREWQKRYRKKTNSGKYPRRRWTFKEDMMLFEYSMTDRELAEVLQRSVGSVQGRRHYLKQKGE